MRWLLVEQIQAMACFIGFNTSRPQVFPRQHRVRHTVLTWIANTACIQYRQLDATCQKGLQVWNVLTAFAFPAGRIAGAQHGARFALRQHAELAASAAADSSGTEG